MFSRLTVIYLFIRNFDCFPRELGILTFISRINYQILRHEPEFSTNFDYFSIYDQLKFDAQLS